CSRGRERWRWSPSCSACSSCRGDRRRCACCGPSPASRARCAAARPRWCTWAAPTSWQRCGRRRWSCSARRCGCSGPGSDRRCRRGPGGGGGRPRWPPGSVCWRPARPGRCTASSA
ncbi:MAG: hypothetical protein AVDCRST_MAG16-768, partial [uncultured Frankineae bacterium]